MNPAYNYQISYGKTRVLVYRTYATPLKGITPVPESSFTGRENILFALEVNVEVLGNNFMPSYTVGDNSMVVATDSMKNFIQRQALAYQGSTLEGFLEFLGREFLSTYSVMEGIIVNGKELPFRAGQVPQNGSFGDSNVLFGYSHNNYATATLEFVRNGEDIAVKTHQCGIVGLELLKVTGSAFTSFVRDEYTTLPERRDRPLFIYMDLEWKYSDSSALLSSQSHEKYVPAEQVKDIIQTVFHEFVSESIQQLIHVMGLRLLERFPQLGEVSFVAQNRTPDPVGASADDPKIKAYTSPFPAFGQIKLTLSKK